MFLSCKTGIYSQNTENIKITFHTKDTANISFSFRGINNFWSRTDWAKKDTNRKYVISEKVSAAECFILKLPNSMLNNYVYLEKGQSLDLEFDKRQMTITGNSIAARQNRLLSEITKSHNVLIEFAQNTMRYKAAIERGRTATPPVEVSKSELYQRVEKLIDQFAAENKDCSVSFLKYVRIENKYFNIKNSINFPAKISKAYYPFTQDELNLMSTVLEDSKSLEGIYSFNYRFVLSAYMDYLRIADPKKVLGNGLDYIMNEIKLCDYVENPVVKQYLAATNLFELFYFNRTNNYYQNIVKQYAGEWAQPIIDECNTYKPKVKIEHPAVEFPKLSGITPEGKPINLSDLKGKWVFIDFWATWCGPCRNQIPYMLELEKKCEDLPLVFLGVSVDIANDKEKWVKAVADEKLVGYQMLSSDKAAVYSQFAISGIPHFAIIDPNGKLYMNAVPFPTTGVLERLLKEIVKNK